jgi:hypothetical protein
MRAAARAEGSRPWVSGVEPCGARPWSAPRPGLPAPGTRGVRRPNSGTFAAGGNRLRSRSGGSCSRLSPNRTGARRSGLPGVRLAVSTALQAWSAVFHERGACRARSLLGCGCIGVIRSRLRRARKRRRPKPPPVSPRPARFTSARPLQPEFVWPSRLEGQCRRPPAAPDALFFTRLPDVPV